MLKKQIEIKKEKLYYEKNISEFASKAALAMHAFVSRIFCVVVFALRAELRHHSVCRLGGERNSRTPFANRARKREKFFGGKSYERRKLNTACANTRMFEFISANSQSSQ